MPKKDALLAELSGLLKQDSDAALLVIDLDKFKEVNDTKGHAEGDACLERIVKTVVAVVGRKGSLFRWGGDEFAVLLPDFCGEEARGTAERIRRAIEQAKPGGDIAVTASIGVCGRDQAPKSAAEQLLDLADKAMYVSKRTGKNRVTMSVPSAPHDEATAS